MKKEEISILAQLINAMDDAVQKLEEAYKEKRVDEISYAKDAIGEIQLKIDKLL